MVDDPAFVLWFTLGASVVTVAVVAVTAAIFMAVRRRSMRKD